MMSRIFSSAALAVVALGVGAAHGEGKVQDRVVGKWALNFDATMKASPEKAAKSMAELKQIGFSMSMEFDAKGKVVATATFGDNKQSKTGAWKVLRPQGKSVVFELSLNDEKKEAVLAEFTDDGKLKLTPQKMNGRDAPVMVFDPVKIDMP